MRRKILLVVGLFAIPITAIAQAPAPPPAPVTPDDFVRQRQQKMDQGGAALAAMRQAAVEGAHLTALAPRIAWLTQWSMELPTMFPDGSDTAASGAMPDVWTDRAGFVTSAERFQTAVRGLGAPAAANDHAALLTAWTAVRASCNGCHDRYKQ